jgi:protein O-mannosyl-transferase
MPGGDPLKHKAAAPPTDRQTVSDSHGAVVGMGLLLVIAVWLVFGQTLRHQFINYDDDQYFSANPQVQAGLTWRGVGWAFGTTSAANWHPLTWLSLMLDAELFGPDPMGPHLTNVLLHAASTVLLFLLLRQLMGLRSNTSMGATAPQAGAYWRSALVAALFGLHPLHVESVAWVAERKDVLSGLFFMLTLWAYANYVSKGNIQHSTFNIQHPTPGIASLASRFTFHVSRSYVLCLFFFALGLMSKPMLVTAPFVLLLLDYWPIQRLNRSTIRHLLLEKLPFFALSAASAAVTLVAQKEAVQPLTHISLGMRAVNATVSYVRYLYKMFWPVNLAVPYPHHGYWPWGVFCLSAVLILAAVIIAFQFRRQFPFLVTGWLWYSGMLVPVIGLVQVGMQSIADRYTYLPLIGIFILLIWGAGETLARWRLPLPAVAGLAILMVAACAVRTWYQLQYWKSSETLFLHAAVVTKGNYTAHYNLGEYYYQNNRLDEAIDHYRQAIQIKPGYDDALNNLGTTLAVKGELDEAVARIREAIRYRPDKADACYNLGNVYVMQHKLNEAADAYAAALRLKPDYPEAHNNLANVLLTQGHRDAAIQHYQEALRLNPGHEGARRQLRSLGIPTRNEPATLVPLP